MGGWLSKRNQIGQVKTNTQLQVNEINVQTQNKIQDLHQNARRSVSDVREKAAAQIQDIHKLATEEPPKVSKITDILEQYGRTYCLPFTGLNSSGLSFPFVDKPVYPNPNYHDPSFKFYIKKELTDLIKEPNINQGSKIFDLFITMFKNGKEINNLIDKLIEQRGFAGLNLFLNIAKEQARLVLDSIGGWDNKSEVPFDRLKICCQNILIKFLEKIVSSHINFSFDGQYL